jgi:ornithine cyclodeaminase
VAPHLWKKLLPIRWIRWRSVQPTDRPQGRESDDKVISHSRVFVDTFPGAVAETGCDPSPPEVGAPTGSGDLHELTNDAKLGRLDHNDITLFKCRAAIEDLAGREPAGERGNPSACAWPSKRGCAATKA